MVGLKLARTLVTGSSTHGHDAARKIRERLAGVSLCLRLVRLFFQGLIHRQNAMHPFQGSLPRR